MVRLISVLIPLRKPLRRLLVLVLGISLAILHFTQFSDAYIRFSRRLFESVGVGPIAPGLVAIAMAIAIRNNRSSVRISMWHRWIAVFLVSITLWGLISYFKPNDGLLRDHTYGGLVGQNLIGPTLFLGALKLSTLTLITISFAFPKKTVISLKSLPSKSATAGRILRTILKTVIQITVSPALFYFKTSRNKQSSIKVTKSTTPPSQNINQRSNATVNIIPKTPNAPKPPTGAIREETIHRTLQTKESGTPATNLNLWTLPPVSLLNDPPITVTATDIEKEETSSLIEKTLRDYGIEVKVAETKPGPVVTMFGLVPGWVRRTRQVKETDTRGQPLLDSKGKPIVNKVENNTRVKIDSIVAREKDLALALAAPSLRIEAPIPGASLVGIEVPNPTATIVTLREIMETKPFKDLQGKSKLALALGKGSGGDVAVADLSQMPHLLIAGSTGSGKSACMNAIISCIIMQSSPWETRLLLIDPKRVELTPYNGLPHLLTPVIVEVDEAVQYLKGMIFEMLRRYKQMEGTGARNIQGYNHKLPPPERMPHIVICVDELADLMMGAPYDIEHSIIRLAQLGRATGIHLVVATQRPSVDVVTGLIKANFPGRISFAVASQVDSRTILDSVGAEKLLGRGDMLFQPPDAPKPQRIQGAFLSDEEIDALMQNWKAQHGPLPPEISLSMPETDVSTGERNDITGDELIDRAIELATSYNKLSTSLLQRRLRIGYPRAARLMDILEDDGIIGPGESGKSRDVLIGKTKMLGSDN